ncbi:MAG: hypothetical protein V8R39_04440 [Clostridia bacterium]
MAKRNDLFAKGNGPNEKRNDLFAKGNGPNKKRTGPNAKKTKKSPKTIYIF